MEYRSGTSTRMRRASQKNIDNVTAKHTHKAIHDENNFY
jgi:hypothetical protein